MGRAKDAMQIDRQFPYGDSEKPQHTLGCFGSFTPVNQAMSATHSTVRARARELDSDMLYDLPDEPPVAPKSGKKSMTKIGHWKSASSSTLTRTCHKETDREISLLNILPESKKMASICSSTQRALFPNAAITRPIQSSMKFLTTENALSAKSVSVGQTTMDKLSSFRYQPAEQNHSMADSHEITHHARATDEEYSIVDARSSKLASHSFNDLDNVCDEASVVGLGDVFVLSDERDQGRSLQGPSVSTQLDSDDFPVDQDLEAEMLQLLMPDESTYDKFSRQSHLQLLHNESLQSSKGGYDHLQPSNPNVCTLSNNSSTSTNLRSGESSSVDPDLCLDMVARPLDQLIKQNINSLSADVEGHEQLTSGTTYSFLTPPKSPALTPSVIENNEYAPLQPFARPDFPLKVCDRSPITGVSANILLRTCFRIGEALREGALCERLGQDAVIELFARVSSSSSGITPFKLHFEFADLFHDRPPLIRGELENHKISALQEIESRMLLEMDGLTPMVRCLGRLKRVVASPPGWLLHIINIRPTDWEEVRWTRGIAGAGMRS